jgi:hypothetical protein
MIVLAARIRKPIVKRGYVAANQLILICLLATRRRNGIALSPPIAASRNRVQPHAQAKLRAIALEKVE